MIYINAFIICGIICALGQIILENTNFTPGHLNTLLVIIGAVISFFGLYEILIDWGGAGATIPITNFGHLLFKGSYEGFQNGGFTGLIKGIFTLGQVGVTISIIMAFLVAVCTKPKN